ncbi:Phosphoacetylglucosamine mutase [Ascobolus immersus RN42]|uniref:Phosphoacetylglucosamine mutase n=1 Tax=Ascobolus immersus RN42 TaxID=1160509 RepID=A0A3N4HSS1_ASCIM|nr:Phosphoacetylglucosamine mutase [Ascobolus immersus RN42]
MSTPFTDAIRTASQAHVKPEGKKFSYGTAGFRMKAELLESVIFRVGLLAAIRSRKLGGKTIGVMITASHNPPEDNGVKLVDPMGEMLEGSWEKYGTQLANAETEDDLVEAFAQICEEQKINNETAANVVYARDTRPSGPLLVRALESGLSAVGANSVDYNILTTPQLHYIVRCLNSDGLYGTPSEAGYYEKLATAFIKLMENKAALGPVTVDCANGVGGPSLRKLAEYIPKEVLEFNIVNDDVDSPAKLNHQCGADFVKTQQKLPPGLEVTPLGRYASLDGDADRIVYYFTAQDGTFHLLDGDKIASLAASFLGDLAKAAGLGNIKVGVVQTAYANGASTAFIEKSLRLPVSVTATGVKHLHHEAATKYDIGVYFEANGHGTVLFNSNCLYLIQKGHEPKSPAEATALEYLRSLTDLINQAVGDALSDLLFVEVALAHKSWSVNEWSGLYTDLPNRLVRVEVEDRTIFQTTDAERKLISPPGIQELIDACVGKYKQGRSFARASGTEDAVRVYAEAASKGEADILAYKVAEVVAAARMPSS